MVVEILGELIRTLGMVVIEVAKHEQFNFCMLGNQSLGVTIVVLDVF